MRITPVGFGAPVCTFLPAGHSAPAVTLPLKAGCFAGKSATRTQKNKARTVLWAVRIARESLERGVDGLTGTRHDDKHDNRYGACCAHDAARPFEHGFKLLA